MRIACWIPKATDTPSEHVTLIASLLQQWLHERPPVLRYTYIACIVYISCDVMDTFVIKTLAWSNIGIKGGSSFSGPPTATCGSVRPFCQPRYCRHQLIPDC